MPGVSENFPASASRSNEPPYQASAQEAVVAEKANLKGTKKDCL